jgi:DNA-binding transcriptional MerR regulator
MERDPRLTTVYDLAMGLEDADRADRLQADSGITLRRVRSVLQTEEAHPEERIRQALRLLNAAIEEADASR